MGIDAQTDQRGIHCIYPAAFPTLALLVFCARSFAAGQTVTHIYSAEMVFQTLAVFLAGSGLADIFGSIADKSFTAFFCVRTGFVGTGTVSLVAIQHMAAVSISCTSLMGAALVIHPVAHLSGRTVAGAICIHLAIQGLAGKISKIAIVVGSTVAISVTLGFARLAGVQNHIAETGTIFCIRTISIGFTAFKAVLLLKVAEIGFRTGIVEVAIGVTMFGVKVAF